MSLALFRLRRKLEHIDLEYLCPECLEHSRFEGTCRKCGLESPLSSTFVTFSAHEVRNRIYDGFTQEPIKLQPATKGFLRGNARERLEKFLVSRLEELFKGYMLDHSVTDSAAAILRKAIREHIAGSGCKKFRRVDKVVIFVKALSACNHQMPQFGRVWEEMLRKVLDMPDVVLYK